MNIRCNNYAPCALNVLALNNQMKSFAMKVGTKESAI